MDKCVYEGEVGFEVKFFFVGDVRGFYDFHLANVYLAG
jgi:hypothetical protein